MDYSQGLLMGDPSLTGLLGGNQPPAMPSVQDGPAQAPFVPPPAVGAALPSPATPVPNPRISLLGRVHDALMHDIFNPVHSAMSSVHNAMSNAVIGSTPPGFDGALSPDEIKAARPGLFNAMFGGAPGETGQQQYQANLETAAKNKMTSAQAMQMQNVLKGRQALFHSIGLPQDGDPATDQQWTTKALAGLMAIGDYDGVKSLSPFAERMYPRPVKGPAAVPFKDPQGNIHFLTPDASTDVPAGWTPVKTAAGSGAPMWFKMPDGTFKAFSKEETPPTGAVPVSTNNIDISQAGTAGRYDKTYAANAVKSFQTDIKPLSTKAQALNEAYDVLSTVANTKDPGLRKTLYGPAISRFVQAVEQSSNLRFQLLQYYASHLDPSVAGHWNLLRDRLMNGSLPGYTIDSMLKAVEDMKDVTSNEIESHRSQATKISPELDGVLPTTDSYFPRFKAGSTPAPVVPVDDKLKKNPFRKGGN